VQGDSGKVSAADMKTLLNEAEKFLPSSAAGAADIKALTEAVKSKFKSRKPCMQASPPTRIILPQSRVTKSTLNSFDPQAQEQRAATSTHVHAAHVPQTAAGAPQAGRQPFTH
jgi:hypothetical protein